ncbi:MAG: Si-specific NAD(P)(+) transhydrogenase [Hyphomonas sp.]|nr:Si-specific NAD(P)(+) transhydrogenase [Alphaproteobacteria bacterium]MCR9223710.1 Si-specific NAD(P)(+) transhydrogenase [Hyphomonas sp.]
MQTAFDLIIIGSGPAGRRAAIQAAKLDKKVLVVEKSRRVGGVSVHTGTIPSKTLRETVLNLSGWRERGFYGRTYKVKSDISADDLRHRLSKTLDHEVDVLEHQFTRNNVTLINGHARFQSATEIEITEEDGRRHTVSFERALISVGTRPYRPDYIPFDGRTVLDSDEILHVETLPRSLTVIGAGVIGIEYATIFSALDISVTVIEPRPNILSFIDDELIDEFTYELRDRGIRMLLGCKAQTVHANDGCCVVDLSDGRKVKSDMVLYAAGRIGASSDIGLENIGLSADSRGRLKVDPVSYETEIPNIYAAGDIIGFPSLASTSMSQGRIAVCHAFSVANPAQPEHFPYGIYAVPEISTVGLSERELKEQGIPYECGIARFRETSRGHIMGIQRGMLKLLFHIETRKLLGVHIVGEGATELIHIGQAVLVLGGELSYFIDNVFNYPTLAEAYKIAALDAWNRLSLHDLQTNIEAPADLAVVNG